MFRQQAARRKFEREETREENVRELAVWTFICRLRQLDLVGLRYHGGTMASFNELRDCMTEVLDQKGVLGTYYLNN